MGELEALTSNNDISDLFIIFSREFRENKKIKSQIKANSNGLQNDAIVLKTESESMRNESLKDTRFLIYLLF